MNLGRRSLLQWASLLALPSRGASAVFERADLHVILGPDSERQQAIVQAMRARFARMQLSADPGRSAAAGRPTAYIAVGPAALQAAIAARLDAPLISTFASRQSFVRATEKAAAGTRVTAIHAEPSPAQQMRLISALYNRTVVVGALISEQSRYMVPLLQRAAQEYRLDLSLAQPDPGVSLSRNLLRLASATVLLIFPDTSLYTPESLRELLEATYRRRQPVIGFSEALVSAGTLASAYTGIEDTMAQLQPIVAAIADGRLPEPQYPRYWRVAVNDSVARSLDVVVDGTVRQMGERP
jgi:ABC-type uncharacterized transport system substrate-binding protein